MSNARLTDTSYAVMGLLDELGPATPYRLKQLAQVSVFYFWTIPHTQIYSECARLAEEGLLTEEREEGGRRRRIYRLADAGRDALTAWRGDPEASVHELRDAGMLKLFSGADPGPLAERELSLHRERLREHERIRQEEPDMPEGMRLALEGGIAHERQYVRFWSWVLEAHGEGD